MVLTQARGIIHIVWFFRSDRTNVHREIPVQAERMIAYHGSSRVQCISVRNQSAGMPAFDMRRRRDCPAIWGSRQGCQRASAGTGFRQNGGNSANPLQYFQQAWGRDDGLFQRRSGFDRRRTCQENPGSAHRQWLPRAGQQPLYRDRQGPSPGNPYVHCGRGRPYRDLPRCPAGTARAPLNTLEPFFRHKRRGCRKRNSFAAAPFSTGNPLLSGSSFRLGGMPVGLGSSPKTRVSGRMADLFYCIARPCVHIQSFHLQNPGKRCPAPSTQRGNFPCHS